MRAGYLLDRLNTMGLPEAYEELLRSYDRIESRSFDYAVVKREERIVAGSRLPNIRTFREKRSGE
ncbi:hypothetical protein ACFCP7_09885 [Paenibacillus elgii]